MLKWRVVTIYLFLCVALVFLKQPSGNWNTNSRRFDPKNATILNCADHTSGCAAGHTGGVRSMQSLCDWRRIWIYAECSVRGWWVVPSHPELLVVRKGQLFNGLLRQDFLQNLYLLLLLRCPPQDIIWRDMWKYRLLILESRFLSKEWISLDLVSKKMF